MELNKEKLFAINVFYIALQNSWTIKIFIVLYFFNYYFLCTQLKIIISRNIELHCNVTYLEGVLLSEVCQMLKRGISDSFNIMQIDF